jgi:transketolase
MDVHAGGPTALLLSRQNLPFIARSAETLKQVARGGYVLQDAALAKAVIIATGSEVSIAIDAQKLLAAEGIAVRVVSMPSTDVFDRQDAAWRSSVLPKGIPCVAVEAGVTGLWHKYVGADGAVIGIDTYGESAPAGALFKHFGLTADKVAQAVKNLL